LGLLADLKKTAQSHAEINTDKILNANPLLLKAVTTVATSISLINSKDFVADHVAMQEARLNRAIRLENNAGKK
jgi:hypothetical protein